MHTKKDFIFMADTLCKITNEKIRKTLCEDLCVKYARDNPRFNAEKFRTACHV
jgi:predicted transglutaminase-like protease